MRPKHWLDPPTAEYSGIHELVAASLSGYGADEIAFQPKTERGAARIAHRETTP